MNGPDAAPGDVLIVEDNVASLQLLAALLERAGHAVRQAPNGELALWSAEARAPELILLDVRMPGIDGYEVCRRLKESATLCAIPVIFLSAQHDIDDKVRGFRAGAIDFIGKPYQAEEVLARTGAHVGLARSQRALSRANAELSCALAALQATRADLLRSERLAALGAMVAGVAHELNTPIGTGMLAASTLDDRARAFAGQLGAGLRRSELERFVADVLQGSDLVRRNLARAAELITSFKQVATDQAGSLRRRFDLAGLVADITVSLEPQFLGRGIALRTAVAPGIAMDSFAGALCQVLNQLLLNALLHGFGEGRGGTIMIEAGAADGALALAVTDDGAGISAPDLDKIFDPFFTTRLGQGSGGLGLHIVHNLVANVLGGSIEAASAPGCTRFLLRCPCQAPALHLSLRHADREPR